MATALLDASVQDRVDALRGRLLASRAKASSLFGDLREEPPVTPKSIEDVISGIRSKVAVFGTEGSIEANPNSGLPMMAGAKHNQK